MNVAYLMRSRDPDDGRPRVIAIAGTSLIHHIEPEEQTRILDVTGQAMGSDGVLMAAVTPNPIAGAGKLLEAQAKLPRPPDVYLVMPLTGVSSPEGVYQTLLEFGRHYGETLGARFVYYHRQARDLPAMVRLLNDSPDFIGVKVGTEEADVKPLMDGVGDRAQVIWGVGDRSTAAAQQGAKGHTSGIAVIYAKASDAIHSAQRRGDFTAARAVEAEIAPLEQIRFTQGRAYNYSAVIEAMRQSPFDDIDAGDGSAPFNPPVPPAVADQVRQAIQGLEKYH
jgi:dihydrodipicolinate synthase/N-acetylneuraminate lyase